MAWTLSSAWSDFTDQYNTQTSTRGVINGDDVHTDRSAGRWIPTLTCVFHCFGCQLGYKCILAFWLSAGRLPERRTWEHLPQPTPQCVRRRFATLPVTLLVWVWVLWCRLCETAELKAASPPRRVSAGVNLNTLGSDASPAQTSWNRITGFLCALHVYVHGFNFRLSLFLCCIAWIINRSS